MWWCIAVSCRLEQNCRSLIFAARSHTQLCGLMEKQQESAREIKIFSTQLYMRILCRSCCYTQIYHLALVGPLVTLNQLLNQLQR
jgi:predicted nucleic-acid-binding Zn-ribbon protein